jgi:hypothetical protein
MPVYAISYDTPGNISDLEDLRKCIEMVEQQDLSSNLILGPEDGPYCYVEKLKAETVVPEYTDGTMDEGSMQNCFVIPVDVAMNIDIGDELQWKPDYQPYLNSYYWVETIIPGETSDQKVLVLCGGNIECTSDDENTLDNMYSYPEEDVEEIALTQ